MLGYLIDNPMINGTSARDRFIPRIRGVKNESFLENDIRSLFENLAKEFDEIKVIKNVFY